MGEEAQETAERCEQVAGRLDGKKTAILDQARTVKQDATEMMQTYLEGEDEALDGFEWLTMAEAGEVGHWRILRTMNERAGNADIAQLAEWAIPIQEGHFRARDGDLAAAGRRRGPERAGVAPGYPSAPVVACGSPTGLDSGEPRWRSQIENRTIDATARNSDCQFCSVRFQNSEVPAYCHRLSAASWWSNCSAL